MNKQILDKSQELLKEIDTLQESIIKSEKALNLLEEIGVGAIEIKPDWDDVIYLGDCHLDEGQKGLVTQLLTSVLKNRIEEAEKELSGILGAQKEEPLPKMEPDAYVTRRAKKVMEQGF